MNNSPIKKHALYSICLLSMFINATSKSAETDNKRLADFSQKSAADQWYSINDDVMGGVSKSNYRITDDNTLEFFGEISLENRGGFASIRTRPTDLNLDGYDTISIRLKGDGRTYYLNMITSSRNTASSYRAPIKTNKGVWQNASIRLNDFVYTTFGQVIQAAATLKADNVRSIGITLADKQPGPFRLEIAQILAEKSSGAAQDAAIQSTEQSTQEKDIVDIAAAAGNFETLLAAAKAAGLVDVLKGNGPLTVFAPTDEAFSKLPEGAVQELLQPENRTRLTALLSYHVVPEKILLAGRSPETLQGRPLAIKAAGPFTVNEANVITADVIASNGVIHIIDVVLIPPSEKSSPKKAAREVIELAIQRGVPLFNAGQPSACSAIYEVAIESLLKSHSSVLDETAGSALRDALDKMKIEDNPHQQAWLLRRAIDTAYKSLSEE